MLIRASDIRKLQIPQADTLLLDAISSLSEASRGFLSWSKQAERLLSSVFDDGHTVAQMRLQLLEQGRTARQQLAAGLQVPTLEYKVRELYPYPIAYRWRELSTLREAKDWKAAYEAILDTYETLLAFCALTSWAAATRSNLAPPGTNQIVKKFTERKSGAGLGDWVNILQHVSSSRAFRDLEPDSCLSVMARLLPQTGELADAQGRLSERRNDESHLRRLDSIRIQDGVQRSLKDLELLLTNSEVLVDLQLVQVLDNKWDSLKGTGQAVLQVLHGEHPLSRVEHREHREHREQDLEKDSLYVIDPRGTWLLLRPLLVRHTCHECGSKSVYHPDHFREKHLMLKALDHGHTCRDTEVEEALNIFLKPHTGDADSS